MHKLFVERFREVVSQSMARLSFALLSPFLQEQSSDWLIAKSSITATRRTVVMRDIAQLLRAAFATSSTSWHEVKEIFEDIDEKDSPSPVAKSMKRPNVSNAGIATTAATVLPPVNVCDEATLEPPSVSNGKLGSTGERAATNDSTVPLGTMKGPILSRKKSEIVIGHRIDMGQKKQVTIDPSIALNVETKNIRTLKRALSECRSIGSVTVAAHSVDTILATQDDPEVVMSDSKKRAILQVQETPCQLQGHLQDRRSRALKRHSSESDAMAGRKTAVVDCLMGSPLFSSGRSDVGQYSPIAGMDRFEECEFVREDHHILRTLDVDFTSVGNPFLTSEISSGSIAPKQIPVSRKLRVSNRRDNDLQS
jgi:hypothetical protein